MTELITIMLGSLLRMVLLGVFAVLIERGVWTDGQVSTLATGLAGVRRRGGLRPVEPLQEPDQVPHRARDAGGRNRM